MVLTGVTNPLAAGEVAAGRQQQPQKHLQPRFSACGKESAVHGLNGENASNVENVPGYATANSSARRLSSKKVIPSRYSQPTSHMPSVRSQLDAATTELLRLRASESEARKAALARSAELHAMRRCLRSECSAADSQISAANHVALVIEAHTQEVERRLSRCEAELIEAEKHKAALDAERHRSAELSAQLDEARASLCSLRDSALPSAARKCEAQRLRAERAEGRAAALEARVDAQRHALAEQASHFERLHDAMARPSSGHVVNRSGDSVADGVADGAGGLVPLTTRALGLFAELYAEKGLHTDARFGRLQDTLVELSMLSNALTSWVPWFVAARASEAKLTLMHANDGGDGGGTSGTIGGTVGGTVGGTIGGTIGGVGAVNGGAGGGVDAGCLAASGVASDVGTVSAPTFDTESTPRLRTPQQSAPLTGADGLSPEQWSRARTPAWAPPRRR